MDMEACAGESVTTDMKAMLMWGYMVCERATPIIISIEALKQVDRAGLVSL